LSLVCSETIQMWWIMYAKSVAACKMVWRHSPQ